MKRTVPLNDDRNDHSVEVDFGRDGNCGDKNAGPDRYR